MAKQTTPPAPAAPLPAPAQDDHHGHGGAYVVNPDTGERELVERTQQPDATAPAEATE